MVYMVVVQMKVDDFDAESEWMWRGAEVGESRLVFKAGLRDLRTDSLFFFPGPSHERVRRPRAP